MITGVTREVLCTIATSLPTKKSYNYVNYMSRTLVNKHFVILKTKEKVNNAFIKSLIDNFKLNSKKLWNAKSDLINHCLSKKKKESFCLMRKFTLIIFQTECPCKTISIPHEETSNEVHPYQRLIFEPISVRRVFDMTTFTVTYIADIRGPADAISKFNGTVRRSLWHF